MSGRRRFTGPARRGCAAILALAAATRAEAQAANTHPDRRYVDDAMPAAARISLAAPPNASASRGMLGDVIATVGTESGPEETIFGRIGAVAVTANGIVVADLSTHDLRVFDASGRFRQRVGRRGAGPGEFRAPQAIQVTSNGEMWVADMQRRVTVFAPGTDGYRLLRTLPVDVGIRSLCVMGNELFANAVSLTDPFGVRVMDSSATTLRSFGKVYTSPNGMVNYQFTEGLVACDSANGVVVYAPGAALGEIRAYSAAGRLMWRTVLDDVKYNLITDTENGVTVRQSPEGAHALVSLHVVPRLGVIAQYGFRSQADMASRGPPSRVITLRLDPRTGAGEVFSTSWPHVALVHDDRAIVVSDDPFPRLEVRSLRVPRD